MSERYLFQRTELRFRIVVAESRLRFIPLDQPEIRGNEDYDSYD
jgi:hypothetical protein